MDLNVTWKGQHRVDTRPAEERWCLIKTFIYNTTLGRQIDTKPLHGDMAVLMS